ncbi:lipid IV(A) palmitoyltransferase PagP [Legionella fallonii]|nr:lipid IV(A) palmitoyltransferase PagP [Legionella fallonii]
MKTQTFQPKLTSRHQRLIASSLLFVSLNAFTAEEPQACSHWLSFFKPACQRLHQIWTEGDTDLYLSGYAWHNRYIYSREKIRTYNEAAWGGGLGKSIFDEKGNWHGLYALAFLDSHKNVEPAVGYAYSKILQVNKDIKVGIGYSVLVTSRTDINHNIPFPGAVPWATLFLGKVSVAAAYIPGNSKNGNVLYIVGKYTF